MQRKTKPDLQVLDPDVEALLASARETPRLPSKTRARALARARASLTARPSSPSGLGARAQRSWLRLVLAVCIVLAAGAVGAALGVVIALHERAADTSEPAASLGVDPHTGGVASAVSERRAQ
jgi:hypothetical protein